MIFRLPDTYGTRHFEIDCLIEKLTYYLYF